MQKFLLSSLFLIPVIGLYSGLSVAVTVPLFALGCLWQLNKLLEFNIKNYKLELALILWALASCLWSLNFTNSLWSGIKSSSEFLLGLVLIYNISKINIPREKIEKVLIASFVVCVLLFTFEYLSGGKVSLLFRQLTQKKESHIFFLHNLDRGIALLSLLAWVIIGSLLQNGRHLIANTIYLTLLGVLVFSDNLAALVGHIAAGLVFLITRFTFLRNPKILCFLLMICASSMVIFALKVNALQISQEKESLPLSAKHRLFIWNFVAENSKTQQLLGIGFNSSRIFPVADEQIVNFAGTKLHPLPMHPHNNILQVYFELGAIGLILYLGLACKYLLAIGKNYMSTDSLEKNWIAAQYACFSAYFIIAMISYNVWQSWWMASIIWISSLFVFTREASWRGGP
jgi:O-antigen ligase